MWLFIQRLKYGHLHTDKIVLKNTKIKECSYMPHRKQVVVICQQTNVIIYSQSKGGDCSKCGHACTLCGHLLTVKERGASTPPTHACNLITIYGSHFPGGILFFQSLTVDFSYMVHCRDHFFPLWLWITFKHQEIFCFKLHLNLAKSNMIHDMYTWLF